MIALILLTCSLSALDCTYSVIRSDLAPMQCMIASMTEPAEFLRDHPNRKFVKAICTDARRIGRYLGRGRA